MGQAESQGQLLWGIKRNHKADYPKYYCIAAQILTYRNSKGRTFPFWDEFTFQKTSKSQFKWSNIRRILHQCTLAATTVTWCILKHNCLVPIISLSDLKGCIQLDMSEHIYRLTIKISQQMQKENKQSGCFHACDDCMSETPNYSF